MEHDLYLILMIFVMKENIIILTLTMCCWLLLQIYLCYLRNVFVVQGYIYIYLYFASWWPCELLQIWGKAIKIKSFINICFFEGQYSMLNMPHFIWIYMMYISDYNKYLLLIDVWIIRCNQAASTNCLNRPEHFISFKIVYRCLCTNDISQEQIPELKFRDGAII